MSIDINRVTIIGRMTRDIEIRTTQSGTNVGKFSIAVNRDYGDKKEVHFFGCIAWGKTADTIQKYAGKGKQICIDGRIHQNRWQDQSGANRSVVELVVEQVQLLGGKSQEQASTGSHEAQRAIPDTDQTNLIDDSDIPF